MSHFSTLMLHEQVHGPQGRIEFAKRIEERYGERRNVAAERPLVKIDGSKDGDETVIYDKGGWVFWMLQNVMGRDNNLAGLQSFIRNHVTNPDHALLEDLVEELRPFAPVWDAQILAAAPGGCGTTNAVLHIRRLLGWLVSAELNA